MSTLSQELRYLARNDFSLILDNESPRGNDWRGLADRMGFSYEMIIVLKQKPSPTLSLLEEWERALGAAATLDKLIGLTEQLECMEAVDILKKAKATKRELLDTVPPRSSTTSTSSSDSRPLSPREGGTDTTLSDHQPLTSHNSLQSSYQNSTSVRTGRAGVDSDQLDEKMQQLAVGPPETAIPHSAKKPNSYNGRGEGDVEIAVQYFPNQRYDVFLSFAQEDEEFAEEVRQRLVTQASLRVFVPADALMAGKVVSEEIADMIKKRCRKTVVILSPHYVTSSWCRYEATQALDASPSAKKHILIPILYRSCEVPAFIAQLYYLDYPRYKDNRERCLKYFWARLYKSLTYNPS